MSIKDMVAGKTVKFVKYQRSELWYMTECGFEFPVPLDETGDAEFLNTDKAMLFMRWIRKYMEFIEAAKQES
jgi:hypothetical protein